MNNISLFAVLTSMTLIGCGKKSSSDDSTKNTVSASALATDTSLSAGVVNEHYSDAMSGITDQGSSGSSLALYDQRLSLAAEDKSSLTRACVASGGKATVTITGAIDRTQSKTSANGKLTVDHTVKGSSTIVRNWSRSDGTAVECSAAKTYAKVSWDSPGGLILEQTFTRQRDATIKVTTARAVRDSSTSVSATGTRKVTWAANSTSADTSTSYMRNKTITSDVTREAVIKDKNGDKKDVKLNLKTKDGASLVVQVERLKSDNTVTSRTIVSGTVVAKKDDTDGSIEMAYTNFKVTISSSECKLASGSATASFLDASGTVLKTYTLSVDSSGDAQLLDSTGTAVDGFSLDACDPEDLQM